jgi:hypothetical protein
MACVPEFESEYEYGRLLCDLIGRLIGEPTVKTTAPADVEIVTFREGKEYLCSAAQISDDYTAREIYPFEISLKVEGKVKSVLLLPDETPVPFKQEGAVVTFAPKDFRIFAMFKIVTE